LARILPINVLDAFHASKPDPMPLLCTRLADGIELTLRSQAFLRDNITALEAIANLWWTRYLEKVNQLAPQGSSPHPPQRARASLLRTGHFGFAPARARRMLTGRLTCWYGGSR
jgi:hypothetical protein